jgi:hypothetical protein
MARHVAAGMAIIPLDSALIRGSRWPETSTRSKPGAGRQFRMSAMISPARACKPVAVRIFLASITRSSQLPSVFTGPGQLADAVANDIWDIGNIVVEPARAKTIDLNR